ncbi:MAG: PAS domain-containing protein [Acidobacteria bacterium]|nr:PAS domain-containing protein [Acidobacteriota bacterium]
MRPTIEPTGKEQFFGEDEIIVSKTDLRGRITYANDVFMQVAGYTEKELLGEAHNIIRHPDMPRAVFQYLWDEIEAGREIFAYVVNLCKNGDHYWVFAHVTPTFDVNGNIIGYHSNRRVPDRPAVDKARDLYAALLAEENRAADWREGMKASLEMLSSQLAAAGCTYEQFVFSL